MFSLTKRILLVLKDISSTLELMRDDLDVIRTDVGEIQSDQRQIKDCVEAIWANTAR